MTGTTVVTESLQRETIKLDERAAAEAISAAGFIVAELSRDRPPVVWHSFDKEVLATASATFLAGTHPGRRFGVFRIVRDFCTEAP